MNSAHQANRTRFLAAASLAMLTLVVGACASQIHSDTEATAPCPGDLRLQCYKRTAQPPECSCVDERIMRQTVESIIGDGPH